MGNTERMSALIVTYPRRVVYGRSDGQRGLPCANTFTTLPLGSGQASGIGQSFRILELSS